MYYHFIDLFLYLIYNTLELFIGGTFDEHFIK